MERCWSLGRDDWRDENVVNGDGAFRNLDLIFLSITINWHCVLLSEKSRVLAVILSYHVQFPFWQLPQNDEKKRVSCPLCAIPCNCHMIEQWAAPWAALTWPLFGTNEIYAVIVDPGAAFATIGSSVTYSTDGANAVDDCWCWGDMQQVPHAQ